MDKVIRHIQDLILINNHKFLCIKVFPSDAKVNYLERDEEYIEKIYIPQVGYYNCKCIEKTTLLKCSFMLLKINTH